MNNIWSENKYVNITINILLFLLGINLMHYGQFALPIICLILFIDRKFKFHVNNIKIFITLCLFAISFFAFSYKQGFYSVMGFCLPMAYYIGSNIYNTNENNIKKIIYILGSGMALHVILNFLTDIVIKKWIIFYSSTHYDVWTQSKISTTATATNYIFIISVIFYLLFIEKNKFIKITSLIIFTIMMIYNIALGQRTVVFMLIVSLLVNIVCNIVLKQKRIKYLAILKYILLVILTIVVIFTILKIIDIPFFQIGFGNSRLISKLINKGLGTERFGIMIDTIKLMPSHLLGNCEISNILGIMPHNVWLDIYDWGGIISFILYVIYSIVFINCFIEILKNNKITKEFKLLIIPLFICITLQMMLEPIMSGASIFLICVILVESLIENLNNYEN